MPSKESEIIAPPLRSEPGVEVAWATIPGHLKRGIVRWVDEGVRPGSFLCAVIANDLFRAVALADPESFDALRLICQFFYNYVPMGCQGSELRMKEWAEYIATTLQPRDVSG